MDFGNLSDNQITALSLYAMHINSMTAIAVDLFIPPRKPRRKRRTWMWPYLQRRLQYGHYDTLMDV